MIYTIRKSNMIGWGYEITGEEYGHLKFHEIAPSVEIAVRYLKGRFGSDVKIRIGKPVNNVIFSGGQSRDGIHGCNYMIAKIDDEELYAEIQAPDDLTTDDVEAFDRKTYRLLKAEIIKQAKAKDIDIETLSFACDGF
jgi:hypothetical protein